MADADELPRGTVIGLSAGFGVLGCILVASCFIIMILCIIAYVKKTNVRAGFSLIQLRGNLTRMRDHILLESTDDGAGKLHKEVEEALKKLKEIQDILRIGHDGVADNMEILKSLKTSLEGTLQITNDVLNESAP